MYNEAPASKTEKEQKVFVLNVELADVKTQKKSTVKGFNEEIKRIQAEINDLISEDKKTFEVI